MNINRYSKLCLRRLKRCLTLQQRHLVLSYGILHRGADDQPPLVMTHGLLGNKYNFNSVGKMLGKNLPNTTIISCDVRNHGASPHADEMNHEVLAGDMVELMDHLNIPKCILLGHSLGGRIAMMTALCHPSRVHRLIVVDVSPGRKGSDRGIAKGPLKYVEAMNSVKWDHGMKRSQARKSAADQLKQVIPDRSIRNFALTNMIEKPDGSYGWRINLGAIVRNARELGRLPDVGEAQYLGRTLFLGGSLSDYILDEDRPDIEKFFPNSMIRHIPDCGHWVHADKPQEFVSSVTEFLMQP